MSKNFMSKEQFSKAFQTLVAERKKLSTRIATKAESAQKAHQQMLLETVKNYSPTAIVKGLADLQLEFSIAVENLSDQLQSELNKLEELRAAIKVQEGNLQEGLDTKIAANMLFILKQEQDLALKNLDAEIELKTQQHEAVIECKQDWEEEKAAFEIAQETYKAELKKTRTKELEEYRYKLERKYKIEEDEYNQDKEKLHYKLNQENKVKGKDWASRSTYLTSQEENLELYKSKVDHFEEELKEKMTKVRQKAIDKANKEADEAAALFDKGVEGAQKVADLEIHSLESRIAEQKEHIAQLSVDLKEALDRVSELSIKALENGRSRPSMN